MIDGAGVGADTITDFTTDDLMRFAAGDNVAADDAVAAPTATLNADITGGKVTFASADDTLTEQLVVAVLETGADEIVFWEDSGDTYVYHSGATGDGSDDELVILENASGFTTLTESIVTAGDFELA